ncbi:MAG: hypothetical protein K6B71_02145 [Alphaproteobacteria bacterium]|nr:hypothetical protein [Alphaproteobacteria bacterium]
MGRIKDWFLGTKYSLEGGAASRVAVFQGEDKNGNPLDRAISGARWDRNGNLFFTPDSDVNDLEKAVDRNASVEVKGNGKFVTTNNYKGILITMLAAAGIAGAVFLWKGFADRDAQIEDLKAKLENCGNEKESLEGQRATAQQAADDESQKLSDCEDENAILLDSIGKLNTRIDTLNFANDSLQKGWYKCRGLDENGNRIVRHNKPNNKPKEDEKSPVKMEIIYGKYDCFKYMTSGDYRGASKK